MNDDYKEDGYSRVRQIPIHIEGRENQSPSPNNTRYTQTRDAPSNTGNDGYGNQNQHHQHHFVNHQTSPPNVSSVNIDYRPPPPPGRPSNQTNSANSNSNNSGISGNSNKAKGDGQRSHSANANHQDSEPKLVNSPEPIPLPPPQAGQFNSEAAKAAAGISVDQTASEQQSQTPNSHQQQKQQQQQKKDDGKSMDEIDKIKAELSELFKKITAFDGLSTKSKEYLYLDEMLTRCTLRLDNIVDPALRQKRKAAINLIDQATDILQRKQKINSDIHDLSQNMAS